MDNNNKIHSSEEDDSYEDEFNEGEIIDETDDTDENSPLRVKKKIRVRKRIRIRKKPSPKKKIKKYAERAFWILIIGGFIAALIIMIVELDIRDERFKQKKKKATPTRSTY